MAHEGIEWRYPGKTGWTDEHQKRLEYELKIINQMGFADYHLIVKEMVVMPEKGGYVAYGVPNDGSGTIRRCYFPKEWAIGTDAKKASGIPQMTFCYNPSGFMASFRGPGAKDAAIKACRIAVAKWRGETFVV